MLRLKKNDRAPVDGIILGYGNKSGFGFVSTDQIDGETDWKIKRALESTQRLFNESEKTLFLANWSIVVEPPSPNLFEFKAQLFNDAGLLEEAIDSKSLILSDTKIVTDELLLLATFVGKERKMSLLKPSFKEKFSRIDNELGAFLWYQLFFTMLVGVIAALFMSDFVLSCQTGLVALHYFNVLMLAFQMFLKGNLIIARLRAYAVNVESDPDIPGTRVRDSQVLEDLGQLEYVLTDKTGTLTQNDMRVRHLRSPAGAFDEESFATLKRMASEFSKRKLLPRADTAQPVATNLLHKNEELLLELLEAMLICNSVMPVVYEGERVLQSASADESALVAFAERLGYLLETRTLNSLSLTTPLGKREDYQVEEVFPFDSERRRMGILVRNLRTSKLLFYCKGSDSVMCRFFSPDEAMFVEQESRCLSSAGFRTLVFGYAEVNEADFRHWGREVSFEREAGPRSAALVRLSSRLELRLTMLGVAGLEDRLQDGVGACLASLREAGIKAWMVTGDKLETARCVALLAGLNASSQDFHEIIATDPEQLRKEVRSLNCDGKALMTTGDALALALADPEIKREFFDAALRAGSVSFCRCSSSQKELIATVLCEERHKVVCCIGDGANDVGMIQKASFGVGIVGKGSLQAALCADASVHEFRALSHLILCHGRNFVTLSDNAILYLTFRSTVWVLANILIIHATANQIFVLFTPFMCSCFNGTFLNWFIVPFFKQPGLSKEIVFSFPSIYKQTQNGAGRSAKNYLIVLFKSIFFAAGAVFLNLVFFQNCALKFLAFTIYTTLLMLIALETLSQIVAGYGLYFIALFIQAGLYSLYVWNSRHVFFSRDNFDLAVLGNIAFISLAVWISFGFCRKLLKMFFFDSSVKILKQFRLKSEKIIR